MEGIIQLLLTSVGGQFALVLSFCLAIGYTIFWVTKFTTAISAEHGIFKESVKTIQTNAEATQKDMAYIKGNLEFLMKHYSDGLSAHNSPLALTEDGVELIKQVQLKEMIIRNWDSIIKLLKDNTDITNKFDVQQFCSENIAATPEKFINKNDLDNLKNIAFIKGLPLMSFNRIMTILIRDKIFNIKE